MSYKKLEVWQLAREISIEIHNMTLLLSRFEQFEEASQIRRSSKSVRSNIVEGYGRKIYKNEFVRFIIYAQSSNDETRDHLETLFETHSLTDEKLFNDISDKIDLLGKILNRFLNSVNKMHNSTTNIQVS